MAPNNNFSSKAVALAFGIVALVFALGFSAFAVWQEPGSAPPAGNIEPPLNISSSAQTKTGDLGIGGGLSYWITKVGDSFALKNNSGLIKLVVGQDGNVGIGIDNPSAALTVGGSVLRYGSTIYGTTNANTHMNLGTQSASGTSGQDYQYITVSGGNQNTASGEASTISGGQGNVASGIGATVSGGLTNTAAGDYSWAGGRNMQLGAAADNTFVWGNSATAYNISAPNAFLIQPNLSSSARVGIGTPNPGYALQVDGGVAAWSFETYDINFHKDGKLVWTMFEDEDGLYAKSAKTGKIYRFVLEEIDER